MCVDREDRVVAMYVSFDIQVRIGVVTTQMQFSSAELQSCTGSKFIEQCDAIIELQINIPLE